MNRKPLPAHPAHESWLMSNFALLKRIRVSAHWAHGSFGSLGLQRPNSQEVRISAHPPIKRAPSFEGLRSLLAVTTTQRRGDGLVVIQEGTAGLGQNKTEKLVVNADCRLRLSTKTVG